MDEKLIIDLLRTSYKSIGPRRLLLLISKIIAEESQTELESKEKEYLMRTAEVIMYFASIIKL